MIEQGAHAAHHHHRFLARTAGAMVMAAALPPSSSSSSSSSSTNSSNAAAADAATVARDDILELAAITTLHLRERKREQALQPSPTDDDSDNSIDGDELERASRDDDDDRKYELKIGFGPVSLARPETVLSSSSSGSSHEKRDSSAAAVTTGSTVRLHSRVRALASFLANNIAGLRRRIAATNAGSVADVSRMRHYMQRRSAPDGANPKLNVLPTRHSGSALRTTLSWEDLDHEFDVDELMLTTPKSRKRARPSDILQDAELRALCHECAVPKTHVDRVIKFVLESFGTVELDMFVLEELVPENIVVFVGMLVFQSLDFCGEIVDLQSLPQFFRHVQTRYRRDMPFHNAAHAADVLHSLFMMLSTTALGDKISPHNQVGALLAAVMHDIEHTGLTNDFLIKTNHEIAQAFPTRAPMESKHIAVAIEVISNPELNVLGKMSAKQKEDVLTVVRETILATALCYQRELLDAVKAVPVAEWAATEKICGAEALSMPLQVLSLRCAMHVSDICQTMKPFTQHQKWVSRLTTEHFLQGKEDERIRACVSPTFCFEEKYSRQEFLVHQTGFLQCMALPAVATLNAIPWLDVQPLVSGVEKNLSEWEAERDM